MDNDIFSHFPDRETFDRYWNENYVPVTYEDVATVFRDFVNLQRDIFIFLIMRRKAVFPRKISRTIFPRRRSLLFRMD